MNPKYGQSYFGVSRGMSDKINNKFFLVCNAAKATLIFKVELQFKIKKSLFVKP
ncbi:hypothetical protein KBB68_01190 [Candidatus Babeliales bacterium]|nr:hypothetical protein [Candidatus Babeliales bacterium]